MATAKFSTDNLVQSREDAKQRRRDLKKLIDSNQEKINELHAESQTAQSERERLAGFIRSTTDVLRNERQEDNEDYPRY